MAGLSSLPLKTPFKLIASSTYIFSSFPRHGSTVPSTRVVPLPGGSFFPRLPAGDFTGLEGSGVRGKGRRASVTCMANPRRVKMVAQQIRREISEMLLFDKVLQQAVLPEQALGADKYLSSVATVSEVEVSGDLQVAKVYVSVYGDERGQELAMAGLKAKAGYVRQGLGRRMRLRFTPEVRFIQDEAMERGSRVLSILSYLKKEREARLNGELPPPNPLAGDTLTPVVNPDTFLDEDFYDDYGFEEFREEGPLVSREGGVQREQQGGVGAATGTVSETREEERAVGQQRKQKKSGKGRSEDSDSQTGENIFFL